MWQHREIRQLNVTLAGRDGDDAQAYQEQQIRDAIAEVIAALKAES